MTGIDCHNANAEVLERSSSIETFIIADKVFLDSTSAFLDSAQEQH